MLNGTLISAAVGIVLGFLAGLGIGGGSLLILWLTVVLNMEYAIARGINLLFFLPSAAASIWFRCRQSTVEWKKIIPAMVCGCIAAALFSWLGWFLDLNILKKLFGGVLILTGLRELFYRPRKAK